MVNKHWRSLGYWLLPGCCVLCGLSSKRNIDLCQYCENALPWMEQRCSHCGINLTAEDAVCGQCLQNPPYFSSCFTAWLYLPPVQHLIRQGKFASARYNLSTLSRLLAEKLRQQYIGGGLPDIIVSVPMHSRRLIYRGFNQSELIAQYLSKQLSITHQPYAIKRQQHTRSLRLLNAKTRKQELRNAFICKQNYNDLTIALVDDIVTTGSTANEIAKTLIKAGAKDVHIWALARTPIHH